MSFQNRLNFSGGPGALPEVVLQQAKQALDFVPEIGLSILGISHRSEWFEAMIDELERTVKTLLELSDDYHVLFLQGGATQQFSMIPMMLLRNSDCPAEYIHSGYWSSKAIPEAQREGPVKVIWSGEGDRFNRLPVDKELQFSHNAPYLHYASNETVEGLQFHRVLGLDGVPRICDMSSDILSRPCYANKFSLIYAHAQKNLGPSGVTLVIIRNELLDKSPSDLPQFLDYRTHVVSKSNFNTPPVFAIYVVLLVTRWIMNEMGGLEGMQTLNKNKSSQLYQHIDASDGFYQSSVANSDRSMMNVCFRMKDESLERKFVEESERQGFYGLRGHRSFGGLRASLYNGLTVEAVDELTRFMSDFQLRNS